MTESGGRGVKVLIVDDFLSAAQGLAKILEIQGHKVELARTGPEGVDTALAFRPDVLLLDIDLPGMSGYEVAERLRSEPAVRNGLMIAMSGHDEESAEPRWRQVGLDHYFVKPVDLEVLIGLIAQGK